MDRATADTRTGLILTGGGARAAYQVGVLRAIARLLPRGAASPFPVICGTSAGALNAASLALEADDFRHAVSRLVRIWANFRSEQVFRSDAIGIARTGAHWLLTMMSAGLLGRSDALYLLDRSPLRRLMETHFDARRLQAQIDAGRLHALSITASGYASHESVSFFQGAAELAPWRRSRRVGCRAQLGVEHLLASSAIPFVFAPQRVNREYFGDGSMRQIAPISPALHLGAGRVLVIGNRHRDEHLPPRMRVTEYPTLGEIAGHVLNSIFLDSLESDIERLQRINRTISLIPRHRLEENGIPLRHVDVLVIAPSRDIGEIAARHRTALPRTLRLLFRGIGAMRPSGASLLSYLLFEKPYCRELIALGFHDAMQQRDHILALLHGQSQQSGSGD